MLDQRSREAADKVLPPCKVCGAKGTGFHYGVTTCEPCKGFFRRCLVRGKIHKCLNKTRLSVSGSLSHGDGKRPCSGCRYARCLQVGMSKDAIQLGRYNLTKKTQDILDFKRHVGENEAVDLTIDDKEDDDCEVDTEDRALLTSLVSVMQENLEGWKRTPGVERLSDPQMRQHIIEFAQVDRSVSADDFLENFLATGQVTDNRFHAFQVFVTYISSVVQKVVVFLKGVPGFKELGIEDQSAIVKDAFIELDCLLHADLLIGGTYFICDGVKITPYILDTVFTAEFTHWVCYFGRRLKELQLTPEEMCLFILILTFDTDRGEFNEPAKVEAIQVKFTSILLKLLHKRYGSKRHVKFGQMISVMTLLRTVGHKANTELDRPSLSLARTFVPTPPLINEIFDQRGMPPAPSL